MGAEVQETTKKCADCGQHSSTLILVNQHQRQIPGPTRQICPHCHEDAKQKAEEEGLQRPEGT